MGACEKILLGDEFLRKSSSVPILKKEVWRKITFAKAGLPPSETSQADFVGEALVIVNSDANDDDDDDDDEDNDDSYIFVMLDTKFYTQNWTIVSRYIDGIHIL